MSAVLTVATCVSAAIWIGLLIWPARPWGTGQNIPADGPRAHAGGLTALIPARNEAHTIEQCLRSVLQQGQDLRVVVIDDASEDDTARRVAAVGSKRVKLVEGEPLPEGWTGKLWALQQGMSQVDTPNLLLMDADIVLAPGILATLRQRLIDKELGLVSIMARLQTKDFWERLLLPAYVYFFKLLYPFALVNSMRHGIAAAAGGCVLLRSEVLADIGGFAALRDALIDDCTLAARVKHAGWPVHIALSQDVSSIRSYSRLADLWRLVSRTAYSQLSHSPLYLALCTLIMLALFIAPLLALVTSGQSLQWAAATALLAMALTQVPLLVFYDLSPLRALALPLVAALFLLMTWSSAWRHWRGTGARWKGRAYKWGGKRPQQEHMR